MKNRLFILCLLFFTLTSCNNNKDSILGTWKGKNYTGQDIQWTFLPDGKASSMRGEDFQELTYKTDNSKTPYHLDVNSLIDTNTLRAIYKFTKKGKLVIGIKDNPVTVRPEGFTDTNLQTLILTKKE